MNSLAIKKKKLIIKRADTIKYIYEGLENNYNNIHKINVDLDDHKIDSII
jgi:hypothetical protein